MSGKNALLPGSNSELIERVQPVGPSLYWRTIAGPQGWSRYETNLDKRSNNDAQEDIDHHNAHKHGEDEVNQGDKQVDFSHFFKFHLSQKHSC